jgi:hypothetical protein
MAGWFENRIISYLTEKGLTPKEAAELAALPEIQQVATDKIKGNPIPKGIANLSAADLTKYRARVADTGLSIGPLVLADHFGSSLTQKGDPARQLPLGMGEAAPPAPGRNPARAAPPPAANPIAQAAQQPSPGGLALHAPQVSVQPISPAFDAGWQYNAGPGPDTAKLAPGTSPLMSKALGIAPGQWDAYRAGVAGIESQGGTYDIMGGAGKRYAGAYQLGMVGKPQVAEAAATLGIPVPTKAELLANPALQEQLFDAYTYNNHNSLMERSAAYRAMSSEEKLKTLGYAHNQGPGGASKYLRTGNAESDAWGTSGAKYPAAVGAQLGKLGPQLGKPEMVSSLDGAPGVAPGSIAAREFNPDAPFETNPAMMARGSTGMPTPRSAAATANLTPQISATASAGMAARSPSAYAAVNPYIPPSVAAATGMGPRASASGTARFNPYIAATGSTGGMTPLGASGRAAFSVPNSLANLVGRSPIPAPMSMMPPPTKPTAFGWTGLNNAMPSASAAPRLTQVNPSVGMPNQMPALTGRFNPFSATAQVGAMNGGLPPAPAYAQANIRPPSPGVPNALARLVGRSPIPGAQTMSPIPQQAPRLQGFGMTNATGLTAPFAGGLGMNPMAAAMMSMPRSPTMPGSLMGGGTGLPGATPFAGGLGSPAMPRAAMPMQGTAAARSRAMPMMPQAGAQPPAAYGPGAAGMGAGVGPLQPMGAINGKSAGNGFAPGSWGNASNTAKLQDIGASHSRGAAALSAAINRGLQGFRANRSANVAGRMASLNMLRAFPQARQLLGGSQVTGYGYL